MGKFNLLDEPWISVIVDDKGTSQEVSLKTLFENAHLYKELAGDTKTQDFAVMRVLLAVLHTVFSRVDATGKVYEVEGRKLFELNERLKPDREMDPAHLDDYEGLLFDTWEDIWGQQKFPCIINDYLEKWRDRFNLLDEEYPFFQVTESVVASDKLNKGKPSEIAGKNINRKVSESGNKTSLFSPKYELDNNKERLSYSEIARWLLMFQGYTGLSDKVIFGKDKYKASKGWLFDIGGICIKGTTLFETLMLNFILPYHEKEQLGGIQAPCWEYSGEEIVKDYFKLGKTNNLARLYTAWSRAVHIDPTFDDSAPFSCAIVKLPEIEHCDNFLEPMTLWRYNKNGDNKEKFTPRKHVLEQAMWRSFGLMMQQKGTNGQTRIPGVMAWLTELKSLSMLQLRNRMITLEAVSMQDDGNATSWVPVNEIIDHLTLNGGVLTDDSDNGWIVRINDTIEFTQSVVNDIYQRYLNDIKRVRNLEKAEGFIRTNIEMLYYCLDTPFREWLASIKPEDDFDETIFKWRNTLKKLVLAQAEENVQSATIRDYRGIEENGHIENIVTVYNKFVNSLNKKFSEEG